MNDLLAALKVADDWVSYYEAYKALYREVVEQRWALGRATFANQLHHTSVPDSSGATLGTIRWAAFSQPSVESLAAFLVVFAGLASAEPHRIRANRYLFMVPNDPPLGRQDAVSALASIANRLDYWCGSLDEALAWPRDTASLQSINVMFQTDKPVVERIDAINLLASPVKMDVLAELRKRILDARAASSSTVGPANRLAYLESSIVLAAVRIGLSPNEVVEVCGKEVGVPAFVASERAKASEWDGRLVTACQRILALAPPATRLYTIVSGDMLTRIVRQYYEQSFESLWPLIRAVNPEIVDPNLIRIGQRMRLPVLGDRPQGLPEFPERS